MAVLPIVRVDNSVLRQKSQRVGRLDKSLRQLIDNMIETMRSAPGVGLAAVQAGVPLRIIVIEIPAEEDETWGGRPLVFLNAEIIKSSGEWTPEEGCLSIPGYVANVKRAQNVTVKDRDVHGREVRVKANGFLAHVFQHEIDHTNGILYIDRLESMDEVRPLSQQRHDAEATPDAPEAPEFTPLAPEAAVPVAQAETG